MLYLDISIGIAKIDRKNIQTMPKYAKLSYFDSLSNKLKNSTLTSRDWWKTFINSQRTNSIPPLFDETTRELEMDDKLKADIFNNYFCGQSCIDEDGKDLPASAVYPDNFPTLSRILVTTSNVYDAIKCLKIGKASGLYSVVDLLV